MVVWGLIVWGMGPAARAQPPEPPLRTHSSPRMHPRTQRAADLASRGSSLVRAGNPVSATAYYLDALHTDPGYEPAYVGLGALYRDANRPSDALEVLEAGYRRLPRSAAIVILLADVLQRTGRSRDAADVLRQAARSSDDLRLLEARADLARERGAFGEAIASYRAILRLAGPDQAELRAEAERYEAALRLLVRDVDPAARCEGTPVRRALCR